MKEKLSCHRAEAPEGSSDSSTVSSDDAAPNGNDGITWVDLDPNERGARWNSLIAERAEKKLTNRIAQIERRKRRASWASELYTTALARFDTAESRSFSEHRALTRLAERVKATAERLASVLDAARRREKVGYRFFVCHHLATNAPSEGASGAAPFPFAPKVGGAASSAAKEESYEDGGTSQAKGAPIALQPMISSPLKQADSVTSRGRAALKRQVQPGDSSGAGYSESSIRVPTKRQTLVWSVSKVTEERA